MRQQPRGCATRARSSSHEPRARRPQAVADALRRGTTRQLPNAPGEGAKGSCVEPIALAKPARSRKAPPPMPVRSPLLLTAASPCLAFAVPAAAAPPAASPWTRFPTIGKPTSQVRRTVAGSIRVRRARARTSAPGAWAGDLQDAAASVDRRTGRLRSGPRGRPTSTQPIRARLVIPGTGGLTAATARVAVEAGYVDIGSSNSRVRLARRTQVGRASPSRRPAAEPHGRRPVHAVARPGSPRSAVPAAPVGETTFGVDRSTSARRRRAWPPRSRSPAARPASSGARSRWSRR